MVPIYKGKGERSECKNYGGKPVKRIHRAGVYGTKGKRRLQIIWLDGLRKVLGKNGMAIRRLRDACKIEKDGEV